tara:strand:- start:145 stop:558 length:414 start_codon:yes stop_codon:yes gene_type:complete
MDLRKGKMGMQISKLINIIEKGLLSLIAILAVVATIEEVVQIYFNRSVQLADLLLLFIYTEVLGMIGIFFVSNKIPITIPIFISMTAIARLIILQGKEMDMTFLLYESGSILILALAVLVVRYKPISRYNYQHEDAD